MISNECTSAGHDKLVTLTEYISVLTTNGVKNLPSDVLHLPQAEAAGPKHPFSKIHPKVLEDKTRMSGLVNHSVYKQDAVTVELVND